MVNYNRLPYFKITLVHKISKSKYIFYQSACEFLAYDETKFDIEIQKEKEIKAKLF